MLTTTLLHGLNKSYVSSELVKISSLINQKKKEKKDYLIVYLTVTVGGDVISSGLTVLINTGKHQKPDNLSVSTETDTTLCQKASSNQTSAFTLTVSRAFEPKLPWLPPETDGGCPTSHLTLNAYHDIAAINMSFSDVRHKRASQHSYHHQLVLIFSSNSLLLH